MCQTVELTQLPLESNWISYLSGNLCIDPKKPLGAEVPALSESSAPTVSEWGEVRVDALGCGQSGLTLNFTTY